MSIRAAAHSPSAARKPHSGAGGAPVRRTRMSGRAAILLIVVFAVLTLAISPLRAYMVQRTQIADLQRQAATLSHENTVLQARLTRLDDPKELERIARECLGMVRPGETAFMTVPKTGTLAPPRC
jgi:cell division protein FtsB